MRLENASVHDLAVVLQSSRRRIRAGRPRWRRPPPEIPLLSACIDAALIAYFGCATRTWPSASRAAPAQLSKAVVKLLAAADGCEVHVPASNAVKASTDRSGAVLALVFLVVIGSFLASSLFVRSASSEIASLSDQLAMNVSHSIEALASVRGAALEVELSLSRLVNLGDANPATLRLVDTSLAELHTAVGAYLILPLSPDERPVHDELQQTWARFEERARQVREQLASGEFERARRRMASVEARAESLMQASMRGIEFNARYGQTLATQISELRHRTAFVAGVLTAASVLLGLIGAALLHWRARRWRLLVDERTRVLEERAAELEQFAGRVAHDIRGPIGAALLAIDALAACEKDEERANVTARLKRSLGRVNAITSGLLEFARAGARPEPGARTSPREVIRNIADEIEAEAARHDIELLWREIPPALVACSEGVYTSLLGNLVRNAIKYMGQSTTRRIIVSVEDDGATIRTEVADTGPGVPENQLNLLFEPYFRGHNAAGREGLGLGLPTVRKLAEGHGGRVGVSSSKGRGSKFWFTLPRAGSLLEDAAPVRLQDMTCSRSGPDTMQ